MQCGDILLQRLVLHSTQRLRLDTRTHCKGAARVVHAGSQIGHGVHNQITHRRRRGFVLQTHFQGLAFAIDTAMADLFIAQSQTHVAGQRFDPLGHRRLHIHLQGKVHAAAQIQAQIHRLGMQGRQPSRRARDQIQRHHVCRVARVRDQRLFQHALGLELFIFLVKARTDRTVFQRQRHRLHRRVFQQSLYARLQRCVHSDCGLDRSHLYSRCFTKEIGQGVNNPHQKRDHNDRVLPDRITVHDRALTLRKIYGAALLRHILFYRGITSGSL